jgi:hypothetical protein
MSKRKQATATELNIHRGSTHEEADRLGELTKDIHENGLKMPILVDEEMNIIDGVRRFYAFYVNHSMTDPIQVVVCSRFEDTCSWLSKTVKHGVAAVPVTALRAWQLFNDTYPQQKERGTRLRKRRTGLKRSEILGEETRSRTMLNEALGFKGESFLATATWIYKMFDTYQEDPIKVEKLARIRRQLEIDEVTIYEAKGMVSKVLRGGDLNGDIVGLNEQRGALATLLSQLTGMTKGTARLGELDPGLTQIELQMYIKGFETARRDLNIFVASLKKRVTTP